MIPLSVKNLSKSFQSGCWPISPVKNHTVLKNVSFDLHQGEILGLLGSNGAGKTTLIQILLGTLQASEGKVLYFGNQFQSNPLQALQKIGYANGYDRLPQRLTIEDNLDIVGRIYNMSFADRKAAIEKFLKLFDMWHLRDQQVGTLSAGQATRMMLAKAFLANPEIVLLDEPTASLDPSIAYHVREFLLEQKQKHRVSIFITSHNMNEVTQLCDRVLVLKDGSIIANSSPIELAQSMGVMQVCLKVQSNIDVVVNYLKAKNVSYSVQEHYFVIELLEQQICSLLSYFGIHQVQYTDLAISKPTLEDYFLSIAKK